MQNFRKNNELSLGYLKTNTLTGTLMDGQGRLLRTLLGKPMAQKESSKQLAKESKIKSMNAIYGVN